ncbi:MAG: L-aspartate oxidase [Candidatus Lumbricidophila eiseniae]|uniref:L-aspartate oxidase n=1 Tax=Candidatus Lumbricidiphila eiseniae TaxID=1969409 RepID=A0A2A6FPS3_9MICO|nr:MAG: L-aspartate oxidase [Candidatus Lumbricidophila eiseniae]
MARILVIGGGIAGLWAAVKAVEARHTVELVTKITLGESNTKYAQGGIAAVLSPGDSPERHIADTLAAGAGLCDPAAVTVLCTEGPARVRDLIRYGVEFDRDDSGLERGLEAAHSRPRIFHAGGDATGAVIESALVETVRKRAVRIDDNTTLLDLVTSNGHVVGARVLTPSGTVAERLADITILATGGSGQLYRHTTNPQGATGDGVAAAWRAGAAVADLEFTQFHPTALAAPGTPLISEAVRGEGAVLRDASGHRFLLDSDPRGELAPRDVVARAVWQRMQEGHPVLLDATALGGDFLAERFPGLDRVVRNAGFNWAVEQVPITPAAHYAMGGITTDLDGRTSLTGLYAIGECARTGVHGANRLASNSLLEAAVFADRAVRSLNTNWPQQQLPAGSPVPIVAVPDRQQKFTRDDLRTLMWDRVGLARDSAGLTAAITALAHWQAPEPTDRQSAEDRNLLDLARLTVVAARARTHSLGAHYRVDGPDTATTEPTTSPTPTTTRKAA